MQWTARMQRRVLGVCWLNESHIALLRVKDLVWRDGWLYALIREEREEEEWEDEEVMPRWIPVIAGYEQVVMKLLAGRDPDAYAFPEFHQLYEWTRYALERQYAARLYEMVSGRTPPVENRRADRSEADGDLRQYDVAAVYLVAHVLGRTSQSPAEIAATYIGRRSRPSRREKT